MIENLVIVESPAKAKTIEKFLGKGFTVKSSFGHIRDLEKKDLGVDIQHNFQPQYEISADKKAIVKELRDAAKEAKTVWLASDEDREGEAIAWHLFEVLKLKPENTKRIVFHEITKDAILYAAASAEGDYGQDLANWQIVEYPKPLTTMEKIMQAFGGSEAKIFAGTPFEDIEKAFMDWDATKSGQVYARIPYEIEIK